MAVNYHTMTTSISSEIFGMTPVVAKLTHKDEYLPPFAMPGPVLSSVGNPVFSAVSEQAQTKTQTAHELPVATDGLTKPVAKPGPVFLSVPEPVLSRASEAKATQTNDVRCLELNANAFTQGSWTRITIHYRSTVKSIVPNTKTHTHDGRDVATTSTSIGGEGPLSPGATPSPPPQTQNISTAKIGWIIAILVACVMTGLSLWLIIRSYSARARARSRRAASMRRSRGAEMLAAGR
jgi:hypothetical protein